MHSLADGHLGSLQDWAIVNHGAKDMVVYLNNGKNPLF